jgi:hypothetical protein
MVPNSFHSISDEALLKKTVVTVGAMLGATVVFVGGLSLVASIAVGHATGTSSDGKAPTSAADDSHATPAMHDTPVDPHGEAPTPASAVSRHRPNHHASESL